VVVHADNDECALRGGGDDRREPCDAVGSEYRLVEDNHCGGNSREQPPEVLRARRCGERLDARLRLEKAPEGRPNGIVAGGDEDGDRVLGDVGGVCGHVESIDQRGAQLIRACG